MGGLEQLKEEEEAAILLKKINSTIVLVFY